MDVTKTAVFNNWNVIAEGWYIACASKLIKKGQRQSLDLCGQKIVIFRGENGKAQALPAYCPHLGTDLGLGTVEKNWIRCKFHRWAFDQTGLCRDIPCQSQIPAKANLLAYATAEKYDFIWVYPAAIAPQGVPDFDELEGKELVIQTEKAFQRQCHHHICMMNGIDAQHLKTIHGLDIEMAVEIDQNEADHQINFTLRGEVPDTTFREKIVRRILGEKYCYSMGYHHGCIGLLTIMKNVRFFPPLRMIYAYRPLPHRDSRGCNPKLSKIEIIPIYVTAKRSGLMGWLISHFLLLCTKLAYYMLRHEDGEIYDNIKFNPNILLPIDAPLKNYMDYVNNLKPSLWSR